MYLLKSICLVLAAVFTIFVAACGEKESSTFHSEPIKIGAIYPFSGPDAATGEDLKSWSGFSFRGNQ